MSTSMNARPDVGRLFERFEDPSEVTDLACEVWGDGERVVLVHGSISTGSMTWQAQRPLAEEGYRLVVPTRRAYGPQTSGAGEDYVTDAEDVAPLLADGAHLVGHSYGGLVAMLVAAARPDAVHSLTLAEPPATLAAADDPDVRLFHAELERVFAGTGSDRDFLLDFLRAVGASAEAFPPEMVDTWTALTPPLRHGRPVWQAPVPVDRLVAASFPILVVSGNHHRAFEAICDRLTCDLNADRAVIEGAGHAVQLVTEPFNATILDLWRRTAVS